jgi:hypothetical protein
LFEGQIFGGLSHKRDRRSFFRQYIALRLLSAEFWCIGALCVSLLLLQVVLLIIFKFQAF